MQNINMKIKKLVSNAIIPTKGSEYAAGYDVYAAIPSAVSVLPHETKKIGTGIAVEFPSDYWLGLFARSGLATKEGLRPANCIGVIDSDYRGEIIVAIHNDSEKIRTIEPNERIGQLILMPCYNIIFNETDTLNDTTRGTGGFASTGK